MIRRRALALVIAAAGAAGCGGPVPPAGTSAVSVPVVTPPAPPASPAAGVPQHVTVTFYAAADNDPPGSVEIAYPNARHAVAGGTGSHDDPLTLATDPRELRPGVRVYYPPLRRYFVMEDDCASCIEEWSSARTPHLDLFVAPSGDPAVEACEAALTPDGGGTVLVDPPPDLPVDTAPLFADGRCWAGTTTGR